MNSKSCMRDTTLLHIKIKKMLHTDMLHFKTKKKLHTELISRMRPAPLHCFTPSLCKFSLVLYTRSIFYSAPPPLNLPCTVFPLFASSYSFCTLDLFLTVPHLL